MKFANPILRKSGEHVAQSIRPDNAEYNLKVAPWETSGKYEIYEMKWPEGVLIPSHIHHEGIETFYILEGESEAVVGGNKFTIKPGDLIHAPKYTPHYFDFCKDTVIIALFFDVNYFSKESGGVLFREYLASETFEPDAQFMKDKIISGDTYMTEFSNPVKNQNYHYLRKKGEQLASYKEGKRTFNLKVPIWETDGNGEIWEVVWEKGAQVDMQRHNLSYESFYVADGSIEVNDGKKTYIAKQGDCVHISPYVSHTFKCISGNAKTINLTYNVNPASQSIQQAKIDMELLKERNPELLEDEEYMKNFMARNDIFLVK